MLGCVLANHAVVQIQSGLRCLSLCLATAGSLKNACGVHRYYWQSLGAFKAGQQRRMHSRALTLPVFGPRVYSETGRRQEWERCMDTTGVNAKINIVPKKKKKKRIRQRDGVRARCFALMCNFTSRLDVVKIQKFFFFFFCFHILVCPWVNNSYQKQRQHMHRGDSAFTRRENVLYTQNGCIDRGLARFDIHLQLQVEISTGVDPRSS